MSDVLRFGKKLFTWSVVAMTIAWSVGLNLVIPAGSAQAALAAPSDIEEGDLIKLEDQTAVYWVNSDMERMYFAFGWLYKTWLPTYDGIKVLPKGSDLDAIAQPGGAVAPRQGSCEAMKSPASPAVYVVSYGGVRHKLASEAAAVALCGADWAKKVHDLPDFVISLFPIGGELDGTTPFPGQLIRSEANGPVYVVGSDSKAYAVDGSLPAFLAADVRVVSQAQWNILGMGQGTRTVASLTDLGQLDSVDDGEDPDEDNTATGDIRVSLAGNTPAGDIVPGGAQNVEYLYFVLEANNGDANVESVTLSLGGVGDDVDFDKVYLYHDGARLDNGRSLTSDGEVTFNLDVDIQDGESEVFIVKADMELIATAIEGDQNRFEIRSADDIEASGDVEGSFPIRGNLMVVGAQDIGTVTITAGGTDADVNIGEDEVLVAEFDADADGDDVHVTSVTLEQKGSTDMDSLSNFWLKRSGTVVAEGVVNGDRVTFEFEEADQIEDGDSTTYRVYADVGVSDVDDTIQFVLDEDSDFSAYSEDNEGYEVGVTNTDLDTTGAMELTIEGGDINVDFDGDNIDARADQTNVSFGTFSILPTSEDLDIDTMSFVLHKTAGAKVIEDLKLRDVNGRGTYTLEATSTVSDESALWTMDVENLSLTQGVAYEFEVIGDMPATATSGNTFYFTWAASSVDGEGSASGNAIATDDFSSASLTGSTVTVANSTLTVRSSALSDTTVVNGTKDVLLMRGTLEAGSSSDVTITSMSFSTTTEGNGADWANRLDSVKLYIVDSSETVNPASHTPAATDNTISSNAAIFDGMQVVVGKGSANRMKFEVYGDITDGSTTGDIGIELTDVDADDEDDEPVDAKNSSGTTIATGAVLDTDRLVTIAGTGTLTMTMDTDYPELKIDRYALAGTEKFLAGRVKFTADREDVVVKELALNFVSSTLTSTHASTTALDKSIDTISLYSSPSMTDESLLATADWAATTTLEDVDFTVVDGVTGFAYVGLKLNSVGTEADATAHTSTSFRMAVSVEAADHDIQGESSNDAITPTITARASGNLTEEITIAPIKITDVSSDFAGGNLVGGNQNIFSFTVTADGGRNTDANGEALSARLINVDLVLSTDVGTAAASNTSALQLCRVDSGNCISLGAAPGDFASSDNTEITLVDAANGTSSVNFAPFETADELVEDGETVEFVVKGTFADVTDKFVQVRIDNLNSEGLSYGVDTSGDATDTPDFWFYDIRKDAPRGTDYPDVTGEALD